MPEPKISKEPRVIDDPKIILDSIRNGEVDALIIKDQVHLFKNFHEAHAGKRLLEEMADSHAAILAIQKGEVDALMISGQVYTLKGADYAYRKIVEQMREGALTVSEDGSILYSNQCFAEISKRDLQQITGRHLLDFISEEDRAEFIRFMKKSYLSSANGKFNLLSGNGKVPVYVSAAALEIGEVKAACYVVSDLSHQLRHESLEQANRVLREADESKTNFIAIASHELRTPLTTVKGYLDWYMEDRSFSSGDQEMLDVIQKGIKQLQSLINSLLDISKIELGKLPMNLSQHTNLHLLLSDCWKAFKPQAEKKALTFELQIESGLKSIRGDENRLREVFDNLLSNALKYTPPKGTIKIIAKNVDDFVEVSVQDNGIGIAPENEQKIFEPFQYIRSVDVEGEVESSGLGLALVKKIVEAHQGRIRLKSELEKGSEFIVRLPSKPSI